MQGRHPSRNCIQDRGEPQKGRGAIPLPAPQSTQAEGLVALTTWPIWAEIGSTFFGIRHFWWSKLVTLTKSPPAQPALTRVSVLFSFSTRVGVAKTHPPVRGFRSCRPGDKSVGRGPAWEVPGKCRKPGHGPVYWGGGCLD